MLPSAVCEALVKLSLHGHGGLLCFSELASLSLVPT
jgi:hypothetical protein